MTATRARRPGLFLSLDFLRDPFGTVEALQHGEDLVFGRVLGWPLALVSTPELAAEVLGGPADIWHKDRIIKRAAAVFGDGLLVSDGEAWKRQRRMLNPGFRHARYAEYAAVMLEEAEALLDGWGDGQRVDLAAEMAAVTLRIAVRTLFGSDLDAAGVAKVGTAFNEVSEFMAGALANSPIPLPRWLPVPSLQRYYASVEALDAVVAEVVAARRAEPEPGDDLLGMLPAARDEDGSALDDAEVRDQVMTFLLAGHETTALLLTHALVLLGLHPAERARAEAEVDALQGDLDFRTSLPVLDAVVAETLRLRPPAWTIAREPVVDTTLGGQPIRAGTIVVIAPWQLHRDPRWWGDDAADFRPDRFAPGAPRPVRGSYIPFGFGGRKCIGLRFAELEARLLLAAWTRRVRVPPESDTLPPLVASVTARPDGPVWATVQHR